MIALAREAPSVVPDRSRSMLADASYLVLGFGGWFVVSCCCVIAMWGLFFGFLGEFEFGKIVLHIDNFSSRYLAADAVRQAGFREAFWMASGCAFAIVALLRHRSFGRILRRLKEY